MIERTEGPIFSEREPNEVIGLKEALLMLEEMQADDMEVLRIIDAAIMEPVPALDDIEGWEAYNAKMRAVSQFALALDGSTSRGKLLKEKIEARLAELGN